jgi:UDP-GlcNAc:undecaprenyl-phosphate/decaprenyl-phosphate GlcNAc-1-phosphate transferase
MLIAYILAGLFAMVVCVFGPAIGRRLHVMDSPDGQRKFHAEPTPLVAGIAVMVPPIVLGLVQAQVSVWRPLYLAIALVSAFFVILGYLDDRRHIRALLRLAISAVAVGAVIWMVPGLAVTVLSFSFDDAVPPIILGPWVGLLFSVLCLVGLQNAANMADGKNGLVIGISLIWTLLMFAYAPDHIHPLLIVLTITLAVSLAFNLSGKVFLGDAGTYGLSVILGLVALYSYNVGFATFPADAAALMFLIPVVDTLRLIVARGIKGRSPFSPDREHLHHILLSLMPWHWALTIYLALVGLPSLIARYNVEWTGGLAVATLTVYALIISQKYRRVGVQAAGAGPA